MKSPCRFKVLGWVNETALFNKLVKTMWSNAVDKPLVHGFTKHTVQFFSERGPGRLLEDSFNVIPESKKDPGFKFQSVVRKKDERVKLSAKSCAQCEAYYRFAQPTRTCGLVGYGAAIATHISRKKFKLRWCSVRLIPAAKTTLCWARKCTGRRMPFVRTIQSRFDEFLA